MTNNSWDQYDPSQAYQAPRPTFSESYNQSTIDQLKYGGSPGSGPDDFAAKYGQQQSSAGHVCPRCGFQY